MVVLRAVEGRMVVTGLDTHELVKRLTSVGFSGEQAEALTAAMRQGQDIDLSNLATKADLAALKVEMAEGKAEILKWMIGQTVVILGAALAFAHLNGH
jgi:hypothetical protein